MILLNQHLKQQLIVDGGVGIVKTLNVGEDVVGNNLQMKD